MADVSEMPRVAEPFFLTFDATVEFLPAMTPADLQKANLDALGKKWMKLVRRGSGLTAHA